MTRIINARFAGTCHCSRTFAQGARVCYDSQTRRVISCYDCTEDRKEETKRRLHATIDPKGD